MQRITLIFTALLLLGTRGFALSAARDGAGVEFPEAKSWAGRSTVVMPSGLWHRYLTQADGDDTKLVHIESDDEGVSWSEPYAAARLPGKGWGGSAAILDRRGEIQMFITRGRTEGDGKGPAVGRFIDVWHIRSADARSKWEEPKRIFEGYTGAISQAIQMRNGRIVVPIGSWVGGRERAAPYGPSEVITYHSDDDGATFTQSAARLVSPVDDNYNGDKVGACEPAVVEFATGKLLLLMRTQAGYLYESTSTDGENWTTAVPSRFFASTGPPSLIRLRDDRVLLTWNSCAMPPKVDGQGVYGGRDALHAAISDSSGERWFGFREVYRDPTRNLEPPKRGDRGTAYPESMLMRDGRVAVISGQGGRRALMYIDPAWLMETASADDFSAGLEGWSVYKSFGPAERWWRNRTQGAELAAHPDAPTKKVLRIRKPDEKSADGATWNFPNGERGSLSVRLQLPAGSSGGSVGLIDCMYDPCDDQGEAATMVRIPVKIGAPVAGTTITADRWHTVKLDWDTASQSCAISVDGGTAEPVAFSNPTQNGLSYLRLRSLADTIDTSGMLIERVDVTVTNP
ncbi:MAG TPA: sialidase family protein [Tepidisphaeraceae bacterium]|nr:sialidase family protein [Tepidisphaeraceae bacterium]